MRVTLLGTGTAVPNGDRHQSGALVDSADRSRRLLVDCGSGVVHRLAEAGVGPAAVDAVALTHTHLDHVADLPSLVKARVLAGEPDLTVHGPRGTVEALDHLLAVDDLHERANVTVCEVAPGTFEAAGFSVTAREADHSTPTLGYRVEDAAAPNGGTDAGTAAADGGEYADAVTFSGDTAASAAIADLADGSAVLVHDCAPPDGGDARTHSDDGAESNGADGADHATPSELAGVLAGRDIETVYLTHLGPETRGKEGAMTATIEGRFPGEVRIANDLTTLEVGDEV
ncbi:MBL fold metallo-hydrolase [Halostella litorea]|uniref:MBL fold metallo-hydrolase n=1 Tax=Halostella litorea TaxID=2528831 RepID=UPI0010930B63|nr:MBL fold metallo-hydrolase [Halostella litorea]